MYLYSSYAVHYVYTYIYIYILLVFGCDTIVNQSGRWNLQVCKCDVVAQLAVLECHSLIQVMFDVPDYINILFFAQVFRDTRTNLPASNTRSNSQNCASNFGEKESFYEAQQRPNTRRPKSDPVRQTQKAFALSA